MSITYLIEIDHNDDGDFVDTNEAISADVLHVEWRLGMSEPFAKVSDVAEAIITVRNQDRRYSPDVSDTIFGKPLRIRSDDGTTVRTHFTGFVREIVPQPGEGSQRLTQIIAYGREHELATASVRMPLTVNIRADEAINIILNQIQWRYAVLEGFCIIGRDSIGDSEIFPDDAFIKSIDNGLSTFAYVGDDWGGGIPALQGIQQFAGAEGGRFYFTRDGHARFVNRHHLLNNPAPLATFDDDMTDLLYTYGNVINRVEVTLTPRSVSAAQSVVWASGIPIRIRSGTRLQVIARYRQDGNAIGAVDISAPQPFTDYQAYTTTDNLTDEVTGQVNIWLSEAASSACILEIENPLAQDITVTFLRVRGIALISEEPQTYIAHDIESITVNGMRRKTLSFPPFSDVDDVYGILAWELQRLSSPHGRIRELHTDTRNHPDDTLALTLLDLITITETQTGHSDTYLIIAEHHEVDAGGTRHRVAWLLEPAETGYFFIIGTHNIGDTSVVMALR